MKRVATAIVAGAAVASLAYASASVLTVTSKPLQAGGASVTCDVDGVNVRWGLETTANEVQSVKVEGIDSACYGKGASVFVGIDGGEGKYKQALTTAPADGVVSISLPAGTAPESINDVKVWIG